MARPQVACISNTLYKRRLAPNVLNKQSWIFDRRLSPSLVNGRGVNSYSPLIITNMSRRASDFLGFDSGFFVRVGRFDRISKDGIYLCLYNQLFALFHYVFKFLTHKL